MHVYVGRTIQGKWVYLITPQCQINVPLLLEIRFLFDPPLLIRTPRLLDFRLKYLKYAHFYCIFDPRSLLGPPVYYILEISGPPAY